MTQPFADRQAITLPIHLTPNKLNYCRTERSDGMQHSNGWDTALPQWHYNHWSRHQLIFVSFGKAIKWASVIQQRLKCCTAPMQTITEQQIQCSTPEILTGSCNSQNTFSGHLDLKKKKHPYSYAIIQSMIWIYNNLGDVMYKCSMLYQGVLLLISTDAQKLRKDSSRGWW